MIEALRFKPITDFDRGTLNDLLIRSYRVFYTKMTKMNAINGQIMIRTLMIILKLN